MSRENATPRSGVGPGGGRRGLLTFRTTSSTVWWAHHQRLSGPVLARLQLRTLPVLDSRSARMDSAPTPVIAERLRRQLFPSYGARANAAEARAETGRLEEPLVLHGADVALLAGHPAGIAHRKAAGRLGTALWEVFPAQVALLDRDGFVVSVNR